MNRGRFQAQGNGLQKSEPWATHQDVDKGEGHRLVNSLEAQLTNGEYQERSNALQKARRFIDTSPVNGHTVVGLKNIIKTFPNSPQRRSIRVDLEIEGGTVFQN